VIVKVRVLKVEFNKNVMLKEGEKKEKEKVQELGFMPYLL
jgi:hypothetical protein